MPDEEKDESIPLTSNNFNDTKISKVNKGRKIKRKKSGRLSSKSSKDSDK
jgi:hypothetical protein